MKHSFSLILATALFSFPSAFPLSEGLDLRKVDTKTFEEEVTRLRQTYFKEETFDLEDDSPLITESLYWPDGRNALVLETKSEEEAMAESQELVSLWTADTSNHSHILALHEHLIFNSVSWLQLGSGRASPPRQYDELAEELIRQIEIFLEEMAAGSEFSEEDSHKLYLLLSILGHTETDRARNYLYRKINANEVDPRLQWYFFQSLVSLEMRRSAYFAQHGLLTGKEFNQNNYYTDRRELSSSTLANWEESRPYRIPKSEYEAKFLHMLTNDLTLCLGIPNTGMDDSAKESLIRFASIVRDGVIDPSVDDSIRKSLLEDLRSTVATLWQMDPNSAGGVFLSQTLLGLLEIDFSPGSPLSQDFDTKLESHEELKRLQALLEKIRANLRPEAKLNLQKLPTFDELVAILEKQFDLYLENSNAHPLGQMELQVMSAQLNSGQQKFDISLLSIDRALNYLLKVAREGADPGYFFWINYARSIEALAHYMRYHHFGGRPPAMLVDKMFELLVALEARELNVSNFRTFFIGLRVQDLQQAKSWSEGFSESTSGRALVEQILFALHPSAQTAPNADDMDIAIHEAVGLTVNLSRLQGTFYSPILRSLGEFVFNQLMEFYETEELPEDSEGILQFQTDLNQTLSLASLLLSVDTARGAPLSAGILLGSETLSRFGLPMMGFIPLAYAENLSRLVTSAAPEHESVGWNLTWTLESGLDNAAFDWMGSASVFEAIGIVEDKETSDSPTIEIAFSDTFEKLIAPVAASDNVAFSEMGEILTESAHEFLGPAKR